ncbi:methyltransferase [Streptomyces cinereoruber]|uniref:methyltransferase n=1 Tax=Streptomyces cinereoruber TaxID=67260 RepID=UPI00363385C8
MHLTDGILAALQTAETDGNRLILTGPRMKPAFYRQVDDVLQAVGGRWTSSAGAHLFPCDAADALAPVLRDRQVTTLREKRTDAQYFPTPPAVVQQLVGLVGIRPGMTVLEPSAGTGAIATALHTAGATVECIERDPGYAALLTGSGVRAVTVADFLTVPAEPRYDRVVMNPPFTRGADLAHVQHAAGFLRPDGLLAAVMSAAVTYQPAAAPFRALVEAHAGTVTHLPPGAFAASGTGVSTVIVTLPASPAPAPRPVQWEPDRADAGGPVDYGDPADIARSIADDLRAALAQIEAIAADLAAPRTPAPDVLTVPLPEPAPTAQLAFDFQQTASAA